MARLPLNRTTAPQVIRLFDSCFKRGVLDACSQDDDYGVREWLERHKADGSYGLVYDDENFDWRRWRFTIERWCREDRLGSVGDTYINSIYVRRNSHNFLFAVLPMTMRFYMMGVEEWLEYPNPLGIERFKHTKKIHWKQMPSHMVNMTTADFLSYLQEFVYERQKKNLEDDLTELQYDSFSIAMYKYTRKYEIPYDEQAEEDI